VQSAVLKITFITPHCERVIDVSFYALAGEAPFLSMIFLLNKGESFSVEDFERI